MKDNLGIKLCFILFCTLQVTSHVCLPYPLKCRHPGKQHPCLFSALLPIFLARCQVSRHEYPWEAKSESTLTCAPGNSIHLIAYSVLVEYRSAGDFATVMCDIWEKKKWQTS